ncbi:tetratricopeptide repeat protein [Streptomyces sp. WMMB 322]|uniref:tetratricopeptide repeat protein n=1 Tax=Streptomyces sp. WMMB 322 TaxID=1286821 RepID=UPI000823EEAE|nr:tetratricopeptide repeat protein [Streptomyces sp. WMMB 322]SCK47660.1 Tetratrico peptide repeat-containing protein [Streptomyces sp. WMMB 322]
MITNTTGEWEQRCAALWDRFDEFEPAEFRSKMQELSDELPEGHPAACFERASACDATDLGEHAVPLYRKALAGGLEGERRRQAVIQLASTLRALGDPEASVELLAEERENGSDCLDDAVEAFLSLALIDVGRERDAAVVALRALSRHLPRYRRSVAAYVEAAAQQPFRG